MTMLERSDWYDIARDTSWTPSYVTEEELFPPEQTGDLGITRSAWDRFDEPYKVSYSEYVKTQREKDSSAYSVKAALERARLFENADPGWISLLKTHYGGLVPAEHDAQTSEARMARFGLAGGMRNMATFGILDENRHTQIQLWFGHEHCSKDRQFDWVHKAGRQNQWVMIAARSYLDQMMLSRDAVSTAIMLTFAAETGFTNMQFVGLAEDAARAGDFSFANVISSIQTDEARHAQTGGGVLKILIDEGRKAEAQRMVDISFARSWRLFCILTGPSMDYYTPLKYRKHSFKEFAREFIVQQFQRQILDTGLDLPWYWNDLINEMDYQHHSYHLGVWFWRPTMFWNPPAGVTPEEREWLEEKYPGWNASFGRCWDVITENLLAGRRELTYPETLPVVCNLTQLPICAVPGDGWNVRDFPLERNGRMYHFASAIDRWIFEQEPEHHQGHLSIVDRFLAGHIQPMSLAGALQYMGLAPGEIGDDAHGYAWVERYRDPALARRAA